MLLMVAGQLKKKHRPGSRNGSRKKNAVKTHKKGLYLGHRRCKCAKCKTARANNKQRLFDAAQAAGHTTTSGGRSIRYGKVSSGGYRSFPGTPPHASQQEKKPSTRNRPAVGWNAETRTWER